MHNVNQSNTLNIKKITWMSFSWRSSFDNVWRTQFIQAFSLLCLFPPLPVAQHFLTLVITLSLFPHTCQAYVQYSNETNPSHNSTSDIERIHWGTECECHYLATALTPTHDERPDQNCREHFSVAFFSSSCKCKSQCYTKWKSESYSHAHPECEWRIK